MRAIPNLLISPSIPDQHGISVDFLEISTPSRRCYSCQNGHRAAKPTFLSHCPTRPKPQHPIPVNPRHKNAAHALCNQPPKTPHAPLRITYSSGPDHRSSPTATYTTILLRLPPTSPILTAETATAKSPNDADAILSVVAATAAATTRIVTPPTPASVSRTAKRGGSQPPYFAMRDASCDEHHYEPPGHQISLRCLSGVSTDARIVPATLSHCSNTATPPVRSTQV